MKDRVVLDTNMLLAILEFKVDVFDEIQRILPGAEVYIPENVLREMAKVVRTIKKFKNAKRLVHMYIRRKGIKVLPVKEDAPVDRTLVELAKRGYIVATNDRELKRKIWTVGGKVITLRERSYLELT